MLRGATEEEEQEAMETGHPRSIEILKQFLGSIEELCPLYAFDVGGGGGLLSKDLLCPRYFRVDILDRDADAVEQARLALEDNKAFRQAMAGTMQNFAWGRSYNAIYMRWVSGYLSDEDLVDFL